MCTGLTLQITSCKLLKVGWLPIMDHSLFDLAPVVECIWWLSCEAVAGTAHDSCCAAELSDADAQSAVDSFGKSDFRRVNNKGAFLMGIIRRVKTEGPDRTHRTSDLDRMHKSVRNRLTDLIDRVR